MNAATDRGGCLGARCYRDAIIHDEGILPRVGALIVGLALRERHAILARPIRISSELHSDRDGRGRESEDEHCHAEPCLDARAAAGRWRLRAWGDRWE